MREVMGDNTASSRFAVSWTRIRDAVLLVKLSGSCTIWKEPTSAAELVRAIEAEQGIRSLSFETGDLAEWDSSLLVFLKELFEECTRRGIDVEREGLPGGVKKLLALASAVPRNVDAGRGAPKPSFFSRIGGKTIDLGASAKETLGFIGECVLAFAALPRGKTRFRRSDLLLLLQECGVGALPIVSLISVLVGLILAFVGAVQLRLFGAQIYVADLVGLGMAREMGAMMTAIIMAGRTGSAFAAQLGTMQVNEEIDALKTLGFPPVPFLVLPRMVALILMLPPLCLYADFMGILGGGIVGVGLLNISPAQYFHETRGAIQLMDFLVGLIKGGVFGILIAMAGCLRGMQCGRSASAVGDASTSAVVTSIVGIVVSDSLLTVIFNFLGI
jgi:phospholipid/cholesterol/gamma-HCH transport system permease protein